jgi:hypothetical protein
MSSTTYNPEDLDLEPEDRAKRVMSEKDDDKKEQCDLRAVNDCFRDGLLDKNEARKLIGLAAREEEDPKDDDDKEDDEPEEDRDDDAEDPDDSADDSEDDDEEGGE